MTPPMGRIKKVSEKESQERIRPMNPASNTASILQKNKKVLIASLTGSAIEWFDYFLYATG
jgi:hypothetical protein